jgi:DNA-binding IclR family transcriptional regulator
MFGTKHDKQLRLKREIELIQHHGPLSAAELARKTHVNRNVISRDLADLEQCGYLLQEDASGRISIVTEGTLLL